MTTLRSSLVLRPAPETDDESASRRRAAQVLDEARGRVALENRLAADAPGLSPEAPHLRLAGRVAAALEGAVLPPERREDIVRHARELGIREFDAQLVIAVIQDRVRRGESLDDMLGPLQVLDRTHRPSLFANIRIVLAGAVIGSAIGLAMLLVRWLTTGA